LVARDGETFLRHFAEKHGKWPVKYK